jgi:hypothetical protein
MDADEPDLVAGICLIGKPTEWLASFSLSLLIPVMLPAKPRAGMYGFKRKNM